MDIDVSYDVSYDSYVALGSLGKFGGCRNAQGLRPDLGRGWREEADQSGGSLGTCRSVTLFFFKRFNNSVNHLNMLTRRDLL